MLYVVFYSATDIHYVPVAPVVVHFAVWISVVLLLITPWPLPLWDLRKESMKRLFYLLGTVIMYPLLAAREIPFDNLLAADMLTSSTLMIWELCYSVCHFTQANWTSTIVRGSDGDISSDPCNPHYGGSLFMNVLKNVVYCLPYWIRTVQCLATCRLTGQGSHAVNAFKYFSSVIVTILSAAQGWSKAPVLWWLWVGSLVFKTAICFYWDVRFDWGLWCAGSPHQFLRPKLLFHAWIYYVSMATNLMGRASWALAISPSFCDEPCTLGLSVVELLRRGQWLVYRYGACPARAVWC
jgi:hypothetical protein